jgi:transcriptional regulator with XRE-family HTH domain
MASKERAADRGTQSTMRALASTGAEIKMARLASGSSLRDVGRAVGLSYSQVGRIERAAHPNVSLLHLVRIAGVVGLDLSIRAYPGARPIRDVAHIALLARFQERLHADLRLRIEVPLRIEGDKRAWDAVVLDRGSDRVAVEAETRISDFQALARRIALKQRDDSVDRVILLVAATRTNRNAVRAAGPLIGEAFALDARATLAELREGRLPLRSAVVFL